MTATPRTMAAQVRSAHAAQAERERIARMGARRLAYSTSTGDAPRVWAEHNEPMPQAAWEPEPHCFVCARHTDHFAEHDDMVEAGTARYGEDGSVYPVPWRWDG